MHNILFAELKIGKSKKGKVVKIGKSKKGKVVPVQAMEAHKVARG
jgi:hypothetical protein